MGFNRPYDMDMVEGSVTMTFVGQGTVCLNRESIHLS